ncbi:hypothetical protein D3C85_1535690 [compost metagenome]
MPDLDLIQVGGIVFHRDLAGDRPRAPLLPLGRNNSQFGQQSTDGSRVVILETMQLDAGTAELPFDRHAQHFFQFSRTVVDGNPVSLRILDPLQRWRFTNAGVDIEVIDGQRLPDELLDLLNGQHCRCLGIVTKLTHGVDGKFGAGKLTYQ